MSVFAVSFMMRLWWVSQEPELFDACLDVVLAVMLPPVTSALFISPLVSTLQSPDCKLGPSNIEHVGCENLNRLTLEICSQWFRWALSKVCQVFTWWHQICEVVLVKETLLWLKLVFWWHWSPSHPSISAQSVRLIGGGGGLGKFLHNIPSSWSKTIWRSDLSLWFITQLRASQVIIECHKMNF